MSESIMTSSERPLRRPYKRHVRNFIIHKPMQKEFSFMIVGLLMVSMLAIGVIIHHTIHAAAGGGGYLFGKVNPYELLSDINAELILRVSIIMFVTLIVIEIFGITFLHRTAGPVYRFQKVLMKINDGEIPEMVRLRENDFFAEIADEINRIIKRLQFEKDRRKSVQAKLEQILSSNPPESVSRDVREVKNLLDKNAEDSTPLPPTSGPTS